MRGSWIALIGIGAAVLYGLVSHGISGSWNFALAFEIGAVVALALSGFRPRLTEEEEGEKTASGENRWRTEEGSDSDDQPTEDGRALIPAAPVVGGPGVSALPQNESDASHTVHSTPTPTPTPNTYTSFSATPAAESPVTLWERACALPHSPIPDPEEDAEYLDLVYGAAEGGHIPALAKLGEHAFDRGAFVEAYFWTKVARRRFELEGDANPQGLKEIDDMLLNVRRAWTAAGRPPEFENCYDNFPEERGELGRAFLRIDIGIEVQPTLEYILALAEKGNPDAALFVTV